jgi:hypothetical protein
MDSNYGVVWIREIWRTLSYAQLAKDLKMGLDHGPAESSGQTHATQPTSGLLKSANRETMALIEENI